MADPGEEIAAVPSEAHDQQCSLWQCPLCAPTPANANEECAMCHNSANLLACQDGHKAACVLCHLKSVAAKKYVDVKDAVSRGAACPVCRIVYSEVQLILLSSIHSQHKGTLATQPLFSREAHATPVAINVRLDALYRTALSRIDDIRQTEMQQVDAAHERARDQIRRVQVAAGSQFRDIMRQVIPTGSPGSNTHNPLVISDSYSLFDYSL